MTQEEKATLYLDPSTQEQCHLEKTEHGTTVIFLDGRRRDLAPREVARFIDITPKPVEEPAP